MYAALTKASLEFKREQTLVSLLAPWMDKMFVSHITADVEVA